MSSSTTTEESSSQVSERAQHAGEVLRKLLALSSFEVTVSVTEDSERIFVAIEPDDPEDSSLLVGRQGRTLSAYQFIANRIVNRFPEDRKMISIDVAGFAERHKNRLQGLADRLHQSVTENNVEYSLIGMSPGDRRTLHLALEGKDEMRTFSQNEGIARRIVVSTKNS